MHTLSQGQALLDRVKQTSLHTKSTTHATTAACYGIEKMLEKLQERRRQLEQMWSQRKSYLEQGFHLCQLDVEISKVRSRVVALATYHHQISMKYTDLNDKKVPAEVL